MLETIPKIEFKESRTDPRFGFELIPIKELFSAPRLPADHSPFNAHRLNFYAILIVESGFVNHTVDFQQYQLSAGNALIISKGQTHSFENSNDYEGTLIVFTEEFLMSYLAGSTISQIARLFNYHLSQVQFQCPEENQAFLLGLRKELSSAMSSSKTNIIACLLAIYLLKLNEYNLEHPEISNLLHYKTFEEFRNRVERKYKISRNAKTYAEELAISYKHLNDISKAFTQKTAKAFIDDYVILEIKRKLCSSSQSIKEISYNIGFDEPSNFLKYFKKLTGFTPLEFRNKYS